MNALFCGHCGAPLAADAAFCGRCGSRLTVAATPAAFYPMAAPAQHVRGSRSMWLLIGGAAAIVVIVLAASIGLRSVGNPPPKCRFVCTARAGVPLGEVHTYASTQWGFHVDYVGGLDVSDQDASHIGFTETVGGTSLASIDVSGSSASKSDDDLVTSTIDDLSTKSLQNVAATRPVNGAHIGDVIGVGRVYDANFYGDGAQAQHVRVVVVAAHRNGVAVTLTAIELFDDSRNNHSGVADPSTLDYMMAEFRWPGES